MSAGARIDERTRRRLTDFLKSLPAEHVRALAALVEEASRSGDAGLPHQLVLDALGPALETGEPAFGKGLAPEQLFARPFEDLIAAPGRPGRRVRIAPSSVGSVWSWLSAELAHETPDGDVAEIVHGGAQADGIARAAALEFYRACARTMAAALSDGTACESLATRLGGKQALEDARDMTAVLEIAGDALEIQERFARPLGALPSADLNRLVLMFDDFAERHPGRAGQFFILLGARMEKPWEVLGVMNHVSARVHSGRLGQDDRSAVLEWLFADLEASGEFFRRLNTTLFDPDRVAEELRAFTRMVNGLSHAGIPTEGRWARRLMTCRSVVAEKMEILMERVPRDVLAALPVHKIGRFGRVRRRPDVGNPPDPGRAEQAIRMARLLERCRPHAAEGAFKVAFSEAAADTSEGLREYAGALIEGMKRLDADSIGPAQAYVNLVIRLTACAAGPEEAGRLRRDAAALGVGGLPDAAVS